MQNKWKIVASIFTVILTSIIALGMINRSSSSYNLNYESEPIYNLAQQDDLTPKQREHSKLYKDDFESRRGRKIINDIQILPSNKDGITLIDIPTGDDFQIGPSIPLPFTGIVCEADAIVLGQVKDSSSHLTENGEFIFSDYDFTVEATLKPNLADLIQPGNNITVTRAGGFMQIGSKKVVAVDESTNLLSINGKYLLFLHYIPTTKSYKAYRSIGSVGIINGKIIKLTRSAVPFQLSTGSSITDLISAIQGININGCSTRQGGTTE